MLRSKYEKTLMVCIRIYPIVVTGSDSFYPVKATRRRSDVWYVVVLKRLSTECSIDVPNSIFFLFTYVVLASPNRFLEAYIT